MSRVDTEAVAKLREIAQVSVEADAAWIAVTGDEPSAQKRQTLEVMQRAYSLLDDACEPELIVALCEGWERRGQALADADVVIDTLFAEAPSLAAQYSGMNEAQRIIRAGLAAAGTPEEPE